LNHNVHKDAISIVMLASCRQILYSKGIMKLGTFIFMGPQGCGKGTQVELLKKYLREKDPETPHFHFATGDGFRAFVNNDNFSSHQSKEIINTGNLQPLFLTIWMWGNAMINSMTGKEHMFIDGYPRGPVEAEVFNSAMDFYDRENRTVVYMKASDAVVKERMKLRARHDDTDEAIEERLRAYYAYTLPALQFFKNNPKYSVVEINGEGTVEEVHNEIVSKLSL
jgi:adenylate kinase